jgi:hypothetical protein
MEYESCSIIYEITYETERTPITLEVQAPDPYSACMKLGRNTKTKRTIIHKIVVKQSPKVIFDNRER